jgi:hypothetical protein
MWLWYDVHVNRCPTHTDDASIMPKYSIILKFNLGKKIEFPVCESETTCDEQH